MSEAAKERLPFRPVDIKAKVYFNTKTPKLPSCLRALNLFLFVFLRFSKKGFTYSGLT